MFSGLEEFGILIAIGVVVFLIIALIAVYVTKYKTVGADAKTSMGALSCIVSGAF